MTKLDNILIRLLADVDDNMEFLGTEFNPKNHAEQKIVRSLGKARQEVEQLVKESNLALLDRVKLGLEDYIDEVRVGNDMAWRQVVHFDDVDTVFEAIRKEYE